MFISRKRFEAAIEKAKIDTRVEMLNEQRIDEIEHDVDDMAHKIEDLECKTASSHDDIRVLWNRIDQLQNELSRIPKCD